MECRLHGVYDLTWQEGGDDDGLSLFATLSYEGFELDVIQDITDGAVSYAVVTRGVIHRMGVGQGLVRRQNPGCAAVLA